MNGREKGEIDVLEINQRINLIRWDIFVRVFDCSISEWKEYLKLSQSGQYSVDDVSFVTLLEKRIKEEKGFLEHIKNTVNEAEGVKV